jgi:hypothetical protein
MVSAYPSLLRLCPACLALRFMRIFSINPLSDQRWESFVSRHPNATPFHAKGWLEALRRTYGYEPIVFTTAPPRQELENGIVFCRICSWITGNRLVSLPFSDHCQPLVDDPRTLALIIQSVEECVRREGLGYAEFRPQFLKDALSDDNPQLNALETYYLHVIDIRPSLETLYRSFHKKSIIHKLIRAQRELTYEVGNSEDLLTKFYHLQVMTRRRHQVPPQPIEWFRNLIVCLSEKVTIRIASKAGQPIASILTIHSGNSIVSKYGCSDAQFHHLGGMPLLIWKGIQEGKEIGAELYDLGRTERHQEGLLTFKNNWGATCSTLTYYRYPHRRSASGASWKSKLVKNVFSRLPLPLFVSAGRFLYRHAG